LSDGFVCYLLFIMNQQSESYREDHYKIDIVKDYSLN
jgi:hypothetical protein